MKYIYLYLTLFLLVYSCSNKYNENKFDELQQISFYSVENNQYASFEELKKNKLILSFINTTCDFCQAEAREMYDKRVELQGIDVVLVSDEESEALLNFMKEYKLDETPIKIWRCKYEEFSKVFPRPSSPSLWLFENKLLIKEYRGWTPLKKVLLAYNNE